MILSANALIKKRNRETLFLFFLDIFLNYQT